MTVQVDVDTRAATKAIRKFDRDAEREMRRTWKGIGDYVARHTSPSTTQQSRMMGSLRGGSSWDGPEVRISNTKGRPYAVGAFMGARRYPSFPKWIGNQHDAGDDSRRGSYGVPVEVQQALDRNHSWVEHEVITAIEDAARRAGLEVR